MIMEIINPAAYEEENLQEDFADVIEEMLAEYEEDNLVELLCECEAFLHTNDIYFKKLDEHGILYNFFAGIDKKCSRRIRDNFQQLHTVTLAVEKKILRRFNDLARLICKLHEKQEKDSIFMQYWINFLIQKVNDHEIYMQRIDIDHELLKWVGLKVKVYCSYSDTKKMLQIVSDIYAITGGNCEVDKIYIEEALETLALSKAEISPLDFAKGILRDLSCLPLYIKDKESMNAVRPECSAYGELVCRIYELVADPNIPELAEAKNESMEELCLPLLKKSIRDESSQYAPSICWYLLEDMKKAYKYAEDEKRRIEETRQREEQKRQDRIYEQRRQEQKEIEERRKNKLLLFSPSSMLSCSLDGYKEDSFVPTNDYGIGKDDMERVKEQIASFSPVIVVKPDGVDKRTLGMGVDEVHMVSSADFYFCLWRQSQKQEKVRQIAFIDYFERKLYVSWFYISDTGKVKKEELPPIRSNMTKEHTREAVMGRKKFADVSDGEIILYRIFESEKYIDTKFEKLDVPYIDRGWRDLLRSQEGRKELIGSLYDFKPEILS